MEKKAFLPFLLFFSLAAGDPRVLSQAKAPPRPGEETLLGKVDKVMEDVVRLRGMPFLQPVARTVCSQREFKAFALEELRKAYPPWKWKALEAAYRALGLLKPGTDLVAAQIELLSAQVGAYYDPSTRTFKLVRGRFKGGIALVFMAHELTHALDDQYYDLKFHQDASKGSSDQSFAMGAVMEGSATTLQMRYMMEGMQEGWLTGADISDQEKMSGAQNKALEEAPPTLAFDLVGRYMMGMYFLSKGNLKNAMRGCRAAVEKAMFDPPLSSEQVLHPAKYWDPRRRDDPVVIGFPRARLVMGRGWRCLVADTLGEIQCALLARPVDFRFKVRKNLMAGPGFWTNPAAAGWGGDRFALYEGRKGRRALLWVAAWDTVKDAAQFLEAFRKYRGNLPAAVLARGKVTAFAFGLEKERAGLVLEALLPRLTFRKAGPWDPGYKLFGDRGAPR